MAKILDNRSSLDQTVRIFDGFYSMDLIINPSEYDIVHGYFIDVCETKNIADNFTVILFRIAMETGINALVLLDEIKGSSNQLQMNKKICYYLNGLKSKTSLYGVGNVPLPNVPVARNVVL